ncbi:MAG: TIM44-like domain-containing protein [Acidobacteriota bacterium]
MTGRSKRLERLWRPGTLRFIAWAGVITALVLGLGVVEIEARPGGGESFGRPGGGGGGGGDDGLISLLIHLWIEIVFRYPAFGVPATVVLLFLIGRIRAAQAQSSTETWDSAPSGPPPAPPPRRHYDFDELRQIDGHFSPVLFDDFAYALFAKAHEARNHPKALDALAPYLSESVRGHLANREPRGAEVSRVLVGAMRLTFLEVPSPPNTGDVRVHLGFEANLSLRAPNGAAVTRYVRERWLLRRRGDAQSRPPEAQRDFGCPNCGAPYQATADQRCGYCQQIVTDGRFDWTVDQIVLIERRDRPPSLRGVVPEVGTHLPTIYQPGLESKIRDFFGESATQTGGAVEAFSRRFGLIFWDLNAAWSELDLAKARPYLSDGLFDYLHFWTEAYRVQGLRNVLDGFAVRRWEFAKITRDRHYDAVTIRFWASGRDSTVEVATGRVVGGDPHRQRPYSEYWTFIRSRRAEGELSAASAERRCPNCGAAHDINMAGVCTHCDTKITRGDFDWVLSKIEQDEAYGG